MRNREPNFEFKLFSKSSLECFFTKRKGETKLGENVSFNISPKYIIIGVCESIGPRANGGNSGAEMSFFPVLNRLLNMQSNRFLNFDDVLVLGYIKCNSIKEDLRAQTEELDQFLLNILKTYVKVGTIPIIIGGGHNNALPLMEFVGSEINDLNVVNLDLHADYRMLEGRHSGNSFSYAFESGFLNKYTVLGLSKRYNSENMLNKLEEDGHTYTFFEDYLDGKRNLKSDISDFCKLNNDKPVGIELDLDSVENMPSSAMTPSAFTMNEARQYVRTLAQMKNIKYLHLPEGAVNKKEDEAIVGKAIAHLITDFIENHQS